jgi:plasmid stabilization system protein ParE
VIELRVTEAAARSIVEQADYYQQVSGDALSERWTSAIDKAARSLCKLPARGAACRFQAIELSGLRWIPIPGFPRHMLFYRYEPEAKVLLIVQVLHGARDLETMLAGNPATEPEAQ